MLTCRCASLHNSMQANTHDQRTQVHMCPRSHAYANSTQGALFLLPLKMPLRPACPGNLWLLTREQRASPPTGSLPVLVPMPRANPNGSLPQAMPLAQGAAGPQSASPSHLQFAPSLQANRLNFLLGVSGKARGNSGSDALPRDGIGLFVLP